MTNFTGNERVYVKKEEGEQGSKRFGYVCCVWTDKKGVVWYKLKKDPPSQSNPQWLSGGKLYKSSQIAAAPN